MHTIGVLDLQNLTVEDLEQIRSVREVAANLLETYDKIVA